MKADRGGCARVFRSSARTPVPFLLASEPALLSNGPILLVCFSMDSRVSPSPRSRCHPRSLTLNHCSLFFTKEAEIAVVGLQVSTLPSLSAPPTIAFRRPERHPS